MLLSNCPFDEIVNINLDYRSRSSSGLARILAKKIWKKEFGWSDTTEDFDFIHIPYNEAVVLIGDLCFEYEKLFRFGIDLSGEWYNYTGLPFTFACWTSNRNLDAGFVEEFNDALKTGIDNIPAVVERYGRSGAIQGQDLFNYLTKNMNYDLNDDKRQAIKLFLNMLSELEKPY